MLSCWIDFKKRATVARWSILRFYSCDASRVVQYIMMFYNNKSFNASNYVFPELEDGRNSVVARLGLSNMHLVLVQSNNP